MSEVVNTQLLQVGSHTYRLRARPIGGKPLPQQQQQHYEDDEDAAAAAAWEEHQGAGDAAGAAADDELIDESLISQEGSSFVTRVSVDPQVVPHVIGKERRKQKEIEDATGATLHIPRPTGQRPSGSGHQQQQQQAGTAPVLGSSMSQVITIKAPTKQALSKARTRVVLVISSAISSRSLDYTHFLSLPLSNEQTAAKLQEFQQQVLTQPGAQDKGFDRSIFINPKMLHLTLLMLKLYSDEARHKAKSVLQGLAPQVQRLLGGQPLQLQLAGLDHMSDEPTDMHVLYLKVRELGAGGKLSQLCDMLVQAFKQAGLTVPGQHEAVKLHATVINTRHRRSATGAAAAAAAAAAVAGQRQGGRGGGGDRHQQQHPQRIGFDGRQLLQDWSGIDMGQFEVPAVHLSVRGEYDASGYYACADALSLTPGSA